ncbi:hypothetical protein [Deminuibacter soli]|nr:hypothetical protein [Deminuibacter soli]
MDDVVHSRPIMDLFGGQNILKRRDATCKLIYSPVGRLGARYITTEKLYAATEDCQEEFYQGAFEDYEQENFDIFGEKVLPMLEKGVASDIYTNKYFGDITRQSDVNGMWSWNKFDGIFTKYAKYIADGTIPASQTFTIPSGELTAQQAHDQLMTAYDAQDSLLYNFDDDLKAFYVDKKLADKYYEWLLATGFVGVVEKQTGLPAKMYFKGIEIKWKKWNGVLAAMNGGTVEHAVILTLRGNWLYAADSKYGGGPRRNEAIRVWWSDDDNVWKRQIHLKAGTEIAAPQHSVVGLSF